MKFPLRRHLDHQIPSWLANQPVYFVTVCAEPRHSNHFCNPLIGMDILQSIGYYHDKGRWFCHVAVLMPDHIHLLLTFPDISSFARVIGEWKKWVVKKQPISWQENFFDHRLRKEEDMDEKAEYILQNPVRAGLIENAADWPYVWWASTLAAPR